ncbi:hypothetical protein Drose_13530 [Dactylosporangium roseum]|uniref:Uncharacterized protein n=1 Tax=Dactylosporangium roseum TaxID=47989 RepID=A0ABY5ZBB9_9ACTN|nr:hypothetical protein [Dactylosporangium roseum]UWZ39152.1 hypothetical protein Drose_13530 [Dactylosporangium roseum]
MAEPPRHRTLTVAPLTVAVDAVPDPHRLRAAVADALAGRPLGAGPEAQVGRAVAAAVRQSTTDDAEGSA